MAASAAAPTSPIDSHGEVGVQLLLIPQPLPAACASRARRMACHSLGAAYPPIIGIVLILPAAGVHQNLTPSNRRCAPA